LDSESKLQQMDINLFTSFYKDKNQARFNELIYCLNKNISNNFNTIHILAEGSEDFQLCSNLYQQSIKGLSNVPYLTIHNVISRPTFSDFFDIMSLDKYKDSINVLANTDIFFDNLDVIKECFEKIDKNNTCLALSRWDTGENISEAIHFERPDTQDTWIFYGNPRISKNIDFGMGIAGCDNSLAYEIEQAGYNVINPSKSIKTYHFHNTGIRNYIENGQVIYRVPPPYKLITPTY
jgi:hypothetical protein